MPKANCHERRSRPMRPSYSPKTVTPRCQIAQVDSSNAMTPEQLAERVLGIFLPHQKRTAARPKAS